MKLGDTVRDVVSGFEGVVLARMECLYAATQYQVHSRELNGDTGRLKASEWFEGPRLEVVKEEPARVGFVHIKGAE